MTDTDSYPKCVAALLTPSPPPNPTTPVLYTIMFTYPSVGVGWSCSELVVPARVRGGGVCAVHSVRETRIARGNGAESLNVYTACKKGVTVTHDMTTKSQGEAVEQKVL